MLVIFALLCGACLVFILTGIEVLRINTKATLNRIFFILCALVAFWSLSAAITAAAPNVHTCQVWDRMSALGWVMVGGFTCHFFVLLSARGRFWHIVWPLYYIPGVLLLIKPLTGTALASDFNRTINGWIPVAAPVSTWLWFYIVYLLATLGTGITLVVLWGARSTRPLEKRQARIIVQYAFISIIGAVFSDIVLPIIGGSDLPYIAPLSILIWFLAIRYAIIRYHFLEITPENAVQEIIAKISEIMILTNVEGYIIKVNPRAKRLLGYEEADLLGKHLSEIVLNKELIQQIFKQCHEDSVPFRNLDLTCKTRYSGQMPIRASFSIIRSKDNFIIGVVMIGQDMRLVLRLQMEITERMRVEKDLRQLTEKLQRMDELKTEFLNMVAHELRTPLSSVLGFAHMLKKKTLAMILPQLDSHDPILQKTSAQMVQNLEIIINESNRLSHLINDLLDIAKLEDGNLEWKMETFQIQEIIDNAMITTQPLLERKGLRMRAEYAAQLPMVQGDKNRLLQVLINLLGNAIKFTSTGTITCRAYIPRRNSVENDERQCLAVAVSDTGIGIPADFQEQLFQKFKQHEDSTDSTARGTGLGLYICKQIVEHHGGHIWVESTLEKGSTFTFTLPADTVHHAS